MLFARRDNRSPYSTARKPAPRRQGRGPYAPLLEASTNVLQLERTLPPATAEALQEVAQADRFDHSATLDVADLDLSELLRSVSQPLARAFLEEDLTGIVMDHSAAFSRRHLYAQLVVIAHDACAKFHTDYVTVRLICTYAGPGTQWLRNEDVVRENLRRTDVDVETANASTMRAPDVTQHCSPGDVILLKGEAFDGNAGLGAVHRSPPLEERSLRRLLFKLDERACGC